MKVDPFQIETVEQLQDAVKQCTEMLVIVTDNPFAQASINADGKSWNITVDNIWISQNVCKTADAAVRRLRLHVQQQASRVSQAMKRVPEVVEALSDPQLRLTDKSGTIDIHTGELVED